MDHFTEEQFDPSENPNDTTGLTTNPFRSFSTEHQHYWESHGIQETGEQNVRCRDCPHGMDIDPMIKVVDGVIQWD